MCGCQDYQSGYYTAYRHMADEELEFVFHYGDYIYEYGPDTPAVRQHSSPLISSLDDYRRRYAQYKADADLQAAHAAHPFFVTFDDHEVRNNWAGDVDDDDGAPPAEVFRLRRQSAFQAWYEHMPVRRAQLPSGRRSSFIGAPDTATSRASTFSTPASSAPTSHAETDTGWPARK